jgi:hypothetical protein
MSDKLKKFIREHRQEFDTNEPGKDLWGKIDAQIKVKSASKISSNWLSKYKYLGFGAGVLVVAVYFITKSLTDSSANELTLNGKDSAVSNPEQYPKIDKNESGSITNENNTTKEVSDFSSGKHTFHDPLASSSNGIKQSTRSAHDSLWNVEKDSVLNERSVEPGDIEKRKTTSTNEKKSKTPEIYLPEEPGEMNSYSGTLYDGSFLCEVLKAYKFHGKIKMTRDRNRSKLGVKETLSTISCNRLEKTENIKAVWLKGKTDEKFSIPLKEGFKNIVLVKSDGREISPEAISHYYPGVGVITGYTGKSLDMVFTDKVELILFFKDVEEGDKIVIDGIIEAVVKNKP